MRERPILFSAPMVRAILDGSKTQTRRVVKGTAGWDFFEGTGVEMPIESCPYGVAGDRLWVREAWRPIERSDGMDGIEFRADGAFEAIANTPAAADAWCDVYHRPGRKDRWRPGIHMPRWASRIDLEITEVRVERLQSITEDDARAEGVVATYNPEGDCWTDGKHRTAFEYAWNEINGWMPNAWAQNPWVWVVGFRRVRP